MRRHEMFQNVKKNLYFIGMVGGTAGFLLIAYLLTKQPDILWMIDSLGAHLHSLVSSNETFTKCAALITFLGNKKTYIVLCTVLAISTIFIKRKKLVIFILCTFILTVIGNSVIKDIFARERPDLLHLVEIGGYSFPSGHAMNSMVFFGLMAYFFSTLVRENWQKIMIIIGFGILILLIAISRVAVGVHYISDISAGLCIGLAIVSFSLFIYEGVSKKES